SACRRSTNWAIWLPRSLTMGIRSPSGCRRSGLKNSRTPRVFASLRRGKARAPHGSFRWAATERGNGASATQAGSPVPQAPPAGQAFVAGEGDPPAEPLQLGDVDAGGVPDLGAAEDIGRGVHLPEHAQVAAQGFADRLQD